MQDGNLPYGDAGEGQGDAASPVHAAMLQAPSDDASNRSPLAALTRFASATALWTSELFASVCVCVQSVILCERDCSARLVVGVVIGATASAICAIVLLVERMDWLYPHQRNCLLQGGAAALLLLWLGAVVVLTFSDPYEVPGNGYFGSWYGLFAALYLAKKNPWLQCLRAWRGAMTPVTSILLPSLVVTAQAAVDCSNYDCRDERAWILSCGAVSTVVCVGLLVVLQCGYHGSVDMSLAGSVLKWAALFLVAWWVGGVGAATFDRPYKETGNGYFGSWGAAAASARLFRVALRSEWKQADDEPSGDAAADDDAPRHSPVPPPPPSPAGRGRRLPPKELSGVCLASLVVTLAVVVEGGTSAGYTLWALICALGSFVITFVLLIVSVCDLDSDEDNVISNVMLYASVFLFGWWCAGIGTMTFHQPFKHTGNGFFASWGAAILAWLFLVKQLPSFKALVDFGSAEIMACCLAGTVLTVQALVDCGESACTEHQGWALSCGILALVWAVAVVLAARFGSCHWVYVSFLVCAQSLWWVAGVAVITFDAPYTNAGNGFFATWGGLIAALVLQRNYIRSVKSVAPIGGPLADGVCVATDDTDSIESLPPKYTNGAE
eukprot:TRINITY_DN5134_c0_g1_i1.p1 TRINITY_DN5134_c0_g1~~TRINITY_DN5134_c0_g1_i1.p1  ORF type:complete len:627 (+),score=190.25 TRINITY_DN5134_c0_g1_i1:54-1883(+)